MSAEVTYIVQVGWAGARQGGLFTIGTSHIEQGDVLGFSFDPALPAYTGPYDDVTAECEAVTVTRGSDDDLRGVVQGTASFELLDRGNGKFNPANPASPLVGKLRPMRPVRIAAVIGSPLTLTYELFNGFLREGSDNPDFGENKGTFQAVDLLVWLDRLSSNMVIPSTGQTTVGHAINLMLDALPWPANQRNIQAGGTIPDFSTDGSRKATEIIGELLDVDRGTFFIDRMGIPTYYSRNFRDTTVPSAVLDTNTSQWPGISLDFVKNRATVTASFPQDADSSDPTNESTYRSNTPQVAVNQMSSDEFGFSDWDSIDSVYLQTDRDARYLANFLVFRAQNPLFPVWAFGASEGPSGIMGSLLGLDLQQKVTIATPGIAGDYHVEKLSHVGEAGKLHKVNLSMTPGNTPKAFIIGSSLIESADVLVY